MIADETTPAIGLTIAVEPSVGRVMLPIGVSSYVTATSDAVTAAPAPDFDGIVVADVSVSISDDEQALSIYLTANTTITRFNDMAGSNPQSYDGSNGTAFTAANDIV